MSQKNPFDDPNFGALKGQDKAANPFSDPDFGKPAGFARKAGDLGLSLLKGAVAIPEAAVGLADIPTGGRVGKFLENEGGAIGFRPKQAKEVISGWQSDDLRSKSQAFQNADGVIDKAATAISNPSLVANAVAESLPLMGAGGVLARGLMAVAPGVGAVGAGAIGEGVMGAGSAAEQMRQETADGTLTAKQSALAGLSGAATAGFGALGGKVAQKLGIGDVDTMIAKGSINAGSVPGKGFIRRGAEGALSEGLLEELPQSLSEQAIQNIGLDKPIAEGMADAAVMGTLAGAAMGGGAGVLSGFGQEPQQAAPGQPPAPAGTQPAAPTDRGFNPQALQAEQNARLDVLAAEEAGIPSVAQTVPPDGAAALAAQRAQAEQARLAQMEASRSEPSPDDEIFQSTGADVASVRASQAMGLDPAAGPMSAAAALAVDGGATARVQAEQALNAAAEAAPKTKTLDEASPEERAAYDAATFDPARTKQGVTDRRKAAIEGLMERAALQSEGQTLAQEDAIDPPFELGGQKNGQPDAAGGKPGNTGADTGLADAGRAAPDAARVPGAASADTAGQPQRFAALSGLEPMAKATPGQKVKSLKEFMAKKKAEREAPNVQDQTPGTAGAQTQAAADQAPQAVGGQPAGAAAGVPAAGDSGVETTGVGQAITQLDNFIEANARTAKSIAEGKKAISEHISKNAKALADEVFDKADILVKSTAKRWVDDPEFDVTSGFAKYMPRFAAGNEDFKAALREKIKSAPVETKADLDKLTIPEMTEAQLRAAAEIYPEGSKRATKARQEIERRAGASTQPTTVKTDGTQAPQAQQAEAQGSQAPAAAAAVAGDDEQGAQWNRMTTTEREALATRAGLNKVAAKNLARRGWQGLDKTQQQNLRKGFGPVKAPDAAAQAPVNEAPTLQSLEQQLFIAKNELENQGPVKNARTAERVRQLEAAIEEQVNPVLFKALDGVATYAKRVRLALDFKSKDESVEAAARRALKAAGVVEPYLTRMTDAAVQAVGVSEQAGQNDELDAEMRGYEAKTDEKPWSENEEKSLIALIGRNGGVSTKNMGGHFVAEVAISNNATKGVRAHGKTALSARRELLRKLSVDATGKPVSNTQTANAEPRTAPDALKEREKAAKAKMLNAAAKLADLLSKNTRANITPEQEQAMLPIAIELFEGAMELGYVKFKQAAKYVRQFIANAIDQDAADALPVDTLQGAYIAVSRRHKDKAITPKAEVITVDTVEEIDAEALDNPAAQADTDEETQRDEDATRQLDRPGTGALAGAPAANVQGAAAAGPAGDAPARSGRGDQPGDAGAGGAGVRGPRGVGSGEGAVSVPAGGSRGERGSAGERRPQADARAERRDEVPGNDGRGNRGSEAGRVEPPAFKPTDFTIEEDFALGEGGQKTKYRNNVEAIRLLQRLEAEQRHATPDEQQVLAKYVGWGGVSQAFDPDNKDWAREFKELRELLSDEEYDAARRSTRYAHYTSRTIIQGMYDAMKRFGFSGGKILEPGAGVGNFMGLMPADLRSSSRMTGVDREQIAAGIARHLYPNQNMQLQDFTQFQALDGYFDAVIGNPPFAKTPLIDQSGRKHLSGMAVHDYFFAKSIDMLRDGGVFAAVVSNGFMDKAGDRARKYIGERTKLLGAIRLPNNAFAKNANTEVTTDIIFLQKLPESEWGSKAAKADMRRWLDVTTIPDPKGGEPVNINQYFADNPQMMLGQYGRFGTMYGPDQPALVARPGQDTGALLRQAIERLPAGVYQHAAVTGTEKASRDAIEALRDKTVQEGGFYVNEGKLYQRMPDVAGETSARLLTPETQWTEKTTLGEARHERLVQLAGIRRTLRDLLAAELADAPIMEGLRRRLNEQYDAYTAKHGLINDATTAQVFDDDPDYPLLAALELNYSRGMGAAAAKAAGIKPYKSKADKAPIFNRRVIEKRQAVQKAETPEDALNVSIAERGRIDATYIGQLLGRPAEEVLSDLTKGDKPALFVDPVTGEHVLRDAYLSGNVRKKLQQAEMAGFNANVRALMEVQPEDVGAHEIVARIGSPWVPTEVYQDFIKNLLGEGTKATVAYVPTNSSFFISVKAGSEVASTVTYGTSVMDAEAILNALLNNRAIKVTYKDSDGKTHLDKEATDAAMEKAADIKAKFQDWLFADAERSEVLVRAYNDTNNNYVTRVYDGSRMQFPGKVPDSIIKFRRHQRNAIARIVQDRTALLDHVVGAGKTFTVIAGAMELKRTGLAKKNLIVVPNHLVKQWAADFYRLYPGANILTATKKDFARENRRRFLAKIATGDWDAVIMAHSSFGFIKPDPDFEMEFNQQQVAHIKKAIEQVDASDGDEKGKKRTVKQMEALLERLEQRIKSLRDKPVDSLLDFKQIGVDQLFVDEAHLFKNLMFSTKMQNVQGLGDSKGSQRAYDMYVKTAQIYAQNGREQGVVFATGTPVSNTLAEMYHMMRYLMPGAMRDAGFESFDAWANTFASVDQVWMQKPSGDGYKASDRMGSFNNAPELLKMFDQVSDTVTMEDIKKAYAEENNGKEFPLPKLKNDRRTPVSLVKSEAQDAYMQDIAARALKLEQKKGPPQKGEDNFLTIMSDARKAAMDIRLVDMSIDKREPGARIDRASDEVVARYKQYDSVKGTQLVFSDLGTPLKHAKKELKEYEELRARIDLANDPELQADAALGDEAAQAKLEDAEAAQEELDAKGRDWLDAIQAAMRGFSVYDDFKAALIEKGVPENEIAFIHDYNTDDQKAALFRKVNAGQIRVVLGSTAKMGAGTNVQERLVALHHLDVPWKPSDIEQREGRIIRQGNKLADTMPGFEVEILAYVTQDTLDMRMWQTQEVKLKMINQLRTRQITREIENPFEQAEMSAGEMQAAATGNMDLLREIQLRADVKKLEQRKRSFDAQRNDLASRRKRATENQRRLPGEIADLEVLSKAATKYAAALEERPFSATINGEKYTSRQEAGAKLRELSAAHEKALEAHRDATKAAREAAGMEFPEGSPERAGAQLDAADAYAKANPKPKMAVEFNGKTYGSKTALGEAMTEFAGDAEPIAWAYGGKELIRRKEIAEAIENTVAESAETDSVVELGAIGGFKVTAEGQRDKFGNPFFEVVLELDGKTQSTTVSTSASDKRSAADAIVKAAERVIYGLPDRLQYAKYDLARAKKALDELSQTNMPDAWPDADKLEKARAEHREVLQRLSGAKEGEGDAGAEPVFSQGLLAPTAMGPKPTVQAVQALVGKVQAVSKDVLPVSVVGNPGEVPGLQVPAGTQPTGVLTGGRIYLFADNFGTLGEAYATLFHEIFHLGLQRVIPAEDYAALLKKFANGAQVQQYMRQWKSSPEGRQRANTMPSAAYEALATEEALAMVAEELSESGIGTNRMPGLAKKMLSWLADVADRLGFPGAFGNWVRGLTQTQAERFVSDMTRAVLGGARNLAKTQAKYGTMTKEMTQQTRLRSDAQEAELAELFNALQAPRGVKLAQAQRQVSAHPMAEQIRNIEANFMDMLAHLDDAKLVQINC